MMEPAVAVTLTEDAVVVPVIRALEPKLTLRPLDRVIVPEYDVTLDEIVISPAAVADVIDILPAVVTGELAFIVTLLPELRVMVPGYDVTALDIVISPAAVADVIDILPAVVIGELVFMMTLLPEVRVILP